MNPAETVTKIRTANGARGGWQALELKLREAIHRDRRGGSTIADGYPTGTLGGPGGGPTALVTDPDTGQEVTVPLTSVESAVVTRMEDTRHRDLLHREVTRALEWLDEAGRAIGAFTHCMSKIDELTGAAPVIEHCASCASAQVEELDTDLPLRYGRIGDVLDVSVFLCRSCYRFGENHRRLPTVEELRRYRSGKALRPFREQAS